MGFNSAPGLGNTSQPTPEKPQEISPEAQKAKEVTSFLNEDFEITNGIEVEENGEKSSIPLHAESMHPVSPMTWNRNGDVVAAVSPNGNLFVAPWTKRTEDKLTSLGFKKDEEIGVPLSRGQMPVHSEIKNRWLSKLGSASRENKLIEEEGKINSTEG